MRAEIEDLKTGWFEISLGLKKKDIDTLIDMLTKLRNQSEQHFHLGSNYEGDGGVSDIEICLDDDSTSDNLSISSFAKGTD